MAEKQLTDAVNNGLSTDNSGTVSLNTGSPESKSSDDGIAFVQQSFDANKKDCAAYGLEINRLLWQIKSLEEQRKIEKFRKKGFMLSDSDMRFYTGLRKR